MIKHVGIEKVLKIVKQLTVIFSSTSASFLPWSVFTVIVMSRANFLLDW